MKSGGLEWATCYANPMVVSTLLRFHLALTPLRYDMTVNEVINPLLIAALAAGHIGVVFHHVPDEEVAVIINNLVILGEDVNDQIEPFIPSRNHLLCGKTDGKHWDSRWEGSNMTPLRWAVENHRPAVVKSLLHHGTVFPRVQDVQTYVALHPEGFGPEHATVPVLDSPCYDLEILRIFLNRHGGEQEKMTVFAETPLGLIATDPDGPERRLRIGNRARRDNLFPVLDLLRTYQRASDPEQRPPRHRRVTAPPRSGY